MTRILVPGDRYCAPMDRGTSSGQAVEASAGLNSTRQSHAGNVRSGHSARNQIRRG